MWTTSERFLPARATIRSVLASESHWLQPLLVLTVRWWPAPVSVGGLFVGEDLFEFMPFHKFNNSMLYQGGKYSKLQSSRKRVQQSHLRYIYIYIYICMLHLIHVLKFLGAHNPRLDHMGNPITPYMDHEFVLR